MTSLEIANQRLRNQHLSGTSFEQPEAVVQWQGAVQAQDYASAKWALGLRLPRCTDDEVERAFTNGSFLRTHLLRPTWHFVLPADIRWMLALTAPRVHALNASHYRKCELDAATFTRSHKALEKALQGGKQLTREELRGELRQAGIVTEGEFRMAYLMMRAELDGIVCSGARRGKQFTYALLEERVPPAKPFARDEALSELVLRYFSSRGPATLQDCVWWSGLTMADAKCGVEQVKPKLAFEVIDGKTYWFAASVSPARDVSLTAHLLPNYDEYFIGFKDRSAIGEALKTYQKDQLVTGLSAHIILVNGQVVGGWKRTLTTNAVEVELNPIKRLTKAEKRAVALAAEQYGAFLELPVVVNWH